jgi:Transposase IS116/IS110/IS902 family
MAAGQQAIASLPLSPHAAYRRTALQSMYVKFETKIEKLNQRVKQQADKRPRARLLMTHPGVGPITALATEVFLGDPSRFAGGKELASYVGMIPGEHSSGKRQRLSGLSTQGNPLLRFLWSEAGIHAGHLASSILGTPLASSDGKNLAFTISTFNSKSSVVENFWLSEEDPLSSRLLNALVLLLCWKFWVRIENHTTKSYPHENSAISKKSRKSVVVVWVGTLRISFVQVVYSTLWVVGRLISETPKASARHHVLYAVSLLAISPEDEWTSSVPLAVCWFFAVTSGSANKYFWVVGDSETIVHRHLDESSAFRWSDSLL